MKNISNKAISLSLLSTYSNYSTNSLKPENLAFKYLNLSLNIPTSEGYPQTYENYWLDVNLIDENGKINKGTNGRFSK